MDYIVLFDVASKPRPWEGVGFIIVFVAGMLFFGRRNPPDASAHTRWANLVISRMGIALAIVALLVSAYSYETNRQRMMTALIRGHVSVVEGVISKVAKKRTMRNDPDCFTVESRSFCFRENVMTPAFNSRLKGGPIREGNWIRVTHQGESILRLETTKGAYERANATADRK